MVKRRAPIMKNSDMNISHCCEGGDCCCGETNTKKMVKDMKSHQRQC